MRHEAAPFGEEAVSPLLRQVRAAVGLITEEQWLTLLTEHSIDPASANPLSLLIAKYDNLAPLVVRLRQLGASNDRPWPTGGTPADERGLPFAGMSSRERELLLAREADHVILECSPRNRMWDSEREI